MSFVEIPAETLSRQALDGLIEEFVTRDGTDYGAEERTLDDKKSAVARQLDRGAHCLERLLDRANVPGTVVDQSDHINPLVDGMRPPRAGSLRVA